MNNVTNANVDV
jgi:nucleolar GTP-binding protein